ncbi:MAG: RCC1 domain-containing protein [Gemmatimonadales bacterium]
MNRTLSLLTALFLWTTGCSDQPLAPISDLAPLPPSFAVATDNGITVNSIDGPTDPVAVNTPVQITAHFAGASGNTHTAVIRWGDGASSVATVNEVDGAGTAAGARSYVLPGVYTVEVEVRDQNGGSVIGTHEYVTVYDPDGGYVSGNGTILSPANACTWSGCVADEGTARFGFSSRYHRGAAIPDGNTRFTFRDGNFTFNSTAYEWLVIAGARAQYKGEGTVNREGNYGFMLTSTDSDRAGGGEEDRFRIKIWDRDNGDAVVYDNQVGTGDDADLTADGTRLTSGSITIRSTTRNEAPVVIITSPADGATFLETEGILLSADAGDAEDGDMSASVAWSSDLAGALGVGAELSDVSLAVGTHTITARVTDSGGLEASASVAVEVVAGQEIVPSTIAAGQYHSCGLDLDGFAYCWGLNNTGQLGNGSTTNSSTPVAVSTTKTFVAISAGVYHTVALTSAGEAFAWGNNFYGQLGDASTTNSSMPVAVSTSEMLAAIDAGDYYTVAITSAGEALAWGYNNAGQLGNGSTTNSSTPVAVSTTKAFVVISAGVSHTVALTAAGETLAWGSNNAGQLGNGTTTSSSTPVVVSTAETFATIDAGYGHTVAVTSAGDAFAWGSNNAGQLGNGTTTSSSTPVVVSTTETFTAISAGPLHTIAITSAGNAFAWGWNAYGQLGDGTTTQSRTPVAVFSAEAFTAIDGGYGHTVAITSAGAAFAWGLNQYGQLGNGTTTDSSTPAAVIGGITFAH